MQPFRTRKRHYSLYTTYPYTPNTAHVAAGVEKKLMTPPIPMLVDRKKDLLEVSFHFKQI